MQVVLVVEQYLPKLEAGLGLAQVHREEVEKRGHSVTVLTHHRPGVSHQGGGVVEVPAIQLPNTRGRAIGLPGLGQVDSMLRRADIVQTYEPGLLAQWVAERARHYDVPSVYVHQPAQPLDAPSVAIINEHSATLCPLPSDHSALARGGVRIPVYTIGYGSIAHKAFATDPHALHRRFNLALETPVILYDGPLSSEANTTLLIDALLPLQHAFYFALSGDGPARQSIQQQIERRDASSIMQVLPQGWARHDLYGCATLALSADGDPHPTWIIEAARYGVPTVAVRSPETEQAIRSRSTGILTLPTKTALNRAVTQLLLRPALRHRYSLQAKEHAKTFAIDRSVDQILDVYALLRRLQHVEG